MEVTNKNDISNMSMAQKKV